MGTSHGVSAYVDRLKGSDVRLTPQREAVLNALLERTADHPTAEEIHESARRHYPGLGLATVYRTLDLFYRAGILRRLEVGDGRYRYELEIRPHLHLICLHCGQVKEVQEGNNWDELARREGFQVTAPSVRLFGYCDRCRAEISTKQSRGGDCGDGHDATLSTPPGSRCTPGYPAR